MTHVFMSQFHDVLFEHFIGDCWGLVLSCRQALLQI